MSKTHMGEEGAQVMISSRKQEHVDAAVAKLRALGCAVSGVVCHVSKAKHRAALIAHATAGLGRVEQPHARRGHQRC